jgi:hypothetical protein
MEVLILDKEPLDRVMAANAALKAKGEKQTEGVIMELQSPAPEYKRLFNGEVHPNVQYEYEAEGGGTYILCVQLTDAAFSAEYPKVRTEVRFSSEFHRSK